MVRLTRTFSKLASVVTTGQRPTTAQLIDRESKIGAEIFGKTSRGVKRRFFMDDLDSWFFSESASDGAGQKLYSFTIRYQILPQGVLKSVDGKGHIFITGEELDHLKTAVALYEKRVISELYSGEKTLQTNASVVA